MASSDGTRLLVVEDVVTSGGQIIESVGELPVIGDQAAVDKVHRRPLGSDT